MKRSPDPHNCGERIGKAVRIMMRSGNVRSRLREALSELAPLRVEDFPIDLRPKFKHVMDQITPEKEDPPRKRDRMHGMKDVRADRIAADLFELFCVLRPPS
jgi:hypothetical protein